MFRMFTMCCFFSPLFSSVFNKYVLTNVLICFVVVSFVDAVVDVCSLSIIQSYFMFLYLSYLLCSLNAFMFRCCSKVFVFIRLLIAMILLLIFQVILHVISWSTFQKRSEGTFMSGKRTSLFTALAGLQGRGSNSSSGKTHFHIANAQ